MLACEKEAHRERERENLELVGIWQPLNLWDGNLLPVVSNYGGFTLLANTHRPSSQHWLCSCPNWLDLGWRRAPQRSRTKSWTEMSKRQRSEPWTRSYTTLRIMNSSTPSTQGRLLFRKRQIGYQWLTKTLLSCVPAAIFHTTVLHCVRDNTRPYQCAWKANLALLFFGDFLDGSLFGDYFIIDKCRYGGLATHSDLRD